MLLCSSVGSGLTELAVRLELGMNFGTAAFSFSDDNDGGGGSGGNSMMSPLVSEAEEMA
jgi:hypothetical protein